MKKKVLTVFLALILAFSETGVAMAATFRFNIPTPFAGSMQVTYTTMEPTNSPYVQPTIYSTVTNYFLSPKGSKTDWATNIVSASEAGKYTFTYRSGYGGSGQYYALSGYPGTSKYTDYTVYGDWSA